MAAKTGISRSDAGHVRILEINRPPHNFFDEKLIAELADQVLACDLEDEVRAVLLCAAGRNFCVGADFADRTDATATASAAEALYRQAARLFANTKPIVAAVQGRAVGGGLGLAMAADFRIASSETVFSANFNRLGIHPGFGLTVTLPRVIGNQAAASLFYTGCPLGGEEAARLGLIDQLVSAEDLRPAALALATEITRSAPLAVLATRATMRQGLREQVAEAMQREAASQARTFATEDFREGIAAAVARRPPVFKRR